MNRWTPNCRCCASNPCSCTWPKVLTYSGSIRQAESAFYFPNRSTLSTPASPYTLTYGPRPADIPADMQLLFFSAPSGVHDPWYVTMPANAWWSAGIPATVFGVATNVYFYLWMQACRANVMVIDAPYGVGSVPADTKGAGNNVISYLQTSCTPFQMKDNLAQPVKITGTHGGDDLVPDATGTAGRYTNPRIGL